VDTEKSVRSNIKIYRKIMAGGGFGDIGRNTAAYVSRDKIEYSVSGCRYVVMFETYGIRGLCKIFCMTDTTAYEGLTRHVTFIRHSDLSDGDACHDEIIRKQNKA